MDAGEKKHNGKSKLAYRLGLIFIGLCVFWMVTTLTETSLLAAGTKAPDWALVRADAPSRKLSLNDLAGKVVVLDFWSVGCPPCVREMEELEAIATSFAPRGVEVVGVAAWGESPDDVREFRKGRAISYPLVLGNSAMISAYKAASLPTIYIIDRNGVIAASHQGYWPRKGISEILFKLLKEP